MYFPVNKYTCFFLPCVTKSCLVPADPVVAAEKLTMTNMHALLHTRVARPHSHSAVRCVARCTVGMFAAAGRVSAMLSRRGQLWAAALSRAVNETSRSFTMSGEGPYQGSSRFLSVEALVGTFNKEEALVGVFSGHFENPRCFADRSSTEQAGCGETQTSVRRTVSGPAPCSLALLILHQAHTAPLHRCISGLHDLHLYLHVVDITSVLMFYTSMQVLNGCCV